MNQNIDHRKKTDESLTVERDKTNQSISEAGKKAEMQTDKNVESHRGEADRKTVTDRDTADSSRPQSGAETKKIEKERQLADEKIEHERERADAAIAKEREKVKTATVEFLQQERGETDKNLKNERADTDASLSAAVKEHLQAKVSIASRDDLIAILSHDLRNPIGNISSAAEMLASESKQPELDTWIHLIKRNAETAIQLIEDIFEMENIAQGKFDLHLQKQNLHHLLVNTAESYARVAQEKNIVISVNPAFADAEAVFDRARLLQALSNLVGNAIKFTPIDGTINLALWLSDSEADITVTDNGPGIPADQHEIIFNRFSQIGTKDRTGLGLGLFISKTFVEAHKGRIWVESAPGKGSTFHITLDRSFGAK